MKKGTKLDRKGTKLKPKRDQVQEKAASPSPSCGADAVRRPPPATPAETPTAPAPQPPEEKKPVWAGTPAVYNPGVCPNCGSSRNTIAKTCAAELTTRGGAILQRLHVCLHCGTRFHSLQTINAIDVGHVRLSKAPVVEW